MATLGFLVLVACSGGGGGGGSTPAPVPPPSNSAPTFSGSTSFSVDEGAVFETTITVSDADGDTISVTLTSDGDGGLFIYDDSARIISASGALDFENPVDQNTDNEYQVTLAASDGNLETRETFTITVLNTDDTLVDRSAIVFKGTQNNTDLGFSVSTVGDLDGDGNSEILFSASQSADAFDGQSSDYVYLAPSSFFSNLAQDQYNFSGGLAGIVRIGGTRPNQAVGIGMEGLGDVNGDGIDDIGIGISELNNEKVVIIDGASIAQLLDGTYREVDIDSIASGGLGIEIIAESGVDGGVGTQFSSLGDVDGDGRIDLLVCSPFTDVGQPNKVGRAYIIFNQALSAAEVSGTSITLSSALTDPNITRVDPAGSPYFGCESDATSAGDFNGDGRADVIMDGIPVSSGAIGSVVVLSGAVLDDFRARPEALILDDVIVENYGLLFEGSETGNGIGDLTLGAGDVNADGFDDIVIAASGSTKGRNSAGTYFLIYGSSDLSTVAGNPIDVSETTVSQGLGVVIDGVSDFDIIGATMRKGGDFDKDGRADLFIGAGFANVNGETNVGESYFILGTELANSSIIELDQIGSTRLGYRLQGMDAFDIAGSDVRVVPDLDGDDVQDFVIGAYGADPDGISRGGEVYVISGASLDQFANQSGIVRIAEYFPSLDE